MAFTEWNMRGVEFANCSCNWGCPCQFNGLPSHGDCRAHGAIPLEFDGTHAHLARFQWSTHGVVR